MQADAVPIKYRIAGKTVVFCSNHVGEIEQTNPYMPCCLVVNRQHLTCRAWMEKPTATSLQQNQNEFLLRISLGKNTAGTARKQPHRRHEWQPKRGCMQLSFQSTRKCLKTIPVQQKDRRWRILRCARKNTAVQVICIGGIFMTLSLPARQSYYYGIADSGIVSVLSACIFGTAE